jgi:hypothetical protein
LSWLRIDDSAPDHPKWMELAEDPQLWAACWGLWVSCAAYCARQLTDGQVPRAYVVRATPLPHKAAKEAAEALVRVGLWVQSGTGYTFHDWLAYNPPAEKVRAKRDAAAERMAAGRNRSRSSDVRANRQRTDSEQTENGEDCSREGTAQFAPPVPVPVPVPPNLSPPAPAGAHAYGPEPKPDAATGTGLYTRLYEQHRAVVDRHAPAGAVRDLGPIAVLHTIREAVQHPLLRDQSPEELERALDLLGVQCQAKADAGEDDPWWLLRSAWQPRVLADAIAMPDVATAKTRATRGRSGPRGRDRQTALESMPPRRAEEFANVSK